MRDAHQICFLTRRQIMFDPHFTYADPKALPPALRALSVVLALAVVGAVLFQSVATATVLV
jgi:hypothetical protein